MPPMAPMAPAASMADLVRLAQGFGSGELADWQKLMRYLHFHEEFTSKSQCRKALKTVWINIVDFLEAILSNGELRFFGNHYALGRYTVRTGKFFPKRSMPKGSPLRTLFTDMSHLRPRGHG
ncbi:hypothetical protein F5Y11DRAFT_344036 [Daldinia sp. FL1419]|nr:hypothetical protein F5Y11DRAFT_344036 [Daldinia sp. FL1419]